MERQYNKEFLQWVNAQIKCFTKETGTDFSLMHHLVNRNTALFALEKNGFLSVLQFRRKIMVIIATEKNTLIGTSMCNPKDTYNLKIGLAIAYARCKANNYKAIKAIAQKCDNMFDEFYKLSEIHPNEKFCFLDSKANIYTKIMNNPIETGKAIVVDDKGRVFNTPLQQKVIQVKSY